MDNEMMQENPIIRLVKDHQTIASILTIIISMVAINTWNTSDIRSDVHEIRADIRETNKRIDAMFQYVLVKEKAQ